MSAFRLLIVEDDDQDLTTCRDTVARYRDEKQREVELVECKSVDDISVKLDNSFDGAIIDLKLSGQDDGGKRVVRQIEQSNFRIPVVILTGTPDAADLGLDYIEVYKKGDSGAGYADLLDRFWGIYNTGLTRIMGGRGKIEETLYQVFRKNLLPQREKWVEYGEKDSSRTEKALLRHTLNHLLQLLDDDGDMRFPEEMYLHPPLIEKIQTGSIVKQKDGNWFAVMNPACDLVIRGTGNYKTDRILLVEIEDADGVIDKALEGIQKVEKKKNKLQTVCGNNHTDYFHWLPNTDFFPGGFLNFRKLSTITKEEYKENYQSPEIQISPTYVKDVVSRFSSYYARQGQPDIDCDGFIARLTSTLVATE